jgi:uncharacterized membrane protein YphA (DoxX/SURF4 family)
MNKATATFLVLLRLVIGWHFLAEGWHKLHTYLDTSPGEKPWSAAGYFREGPGPLARVLRTQLGDPDSDALALFDVQPVPQGQDPATYPPVKRVPPQLAAEWQSYLDRFAARYSLSPDQLAEARAKLEQAKANVVGWLTDPEIDPQYKGIPRTFQSVSYPLRRSVPERIAEYRQGVRNVHLLTDRGVILLGKEAPALLAQAKAEAAEDRKYLLADLHNDNTIPFQQSLAALLTLEQKYPNPGETQAVRGRIVAGFGLAAFSEQTGGIPQASSALTAAAVDVSPVPEPLPEPPNRFLTWINHLTAWGLTVLGACLLLGLFTRTSCVLAALFLLMTYLCMPPWPWFVAAPNNEGFYYFVNKNVIEMLALVALATTGSGEWFGLDALVHETFAYLRGRPVRRPSPSPAAR